MTAFAKMGQTWVLERVPGGLTTKRREDVVLGVKWWGELKGPVSPEPQVV